MKSKLITRERTLIFALFVIWGTNYSTSFYYAIFLILLCIFFYAITVGRMRIPFGRKEDYIALSFLLVWLYGLIRGLILGNPLNYVTANFAGMVCYIFYFFLTTFHAGLFKLMKILIIAGISVSVLSIILISIFILGINNDALNLILGESVWAIASTGQERVYFSNLAIAYPLMGYAFFLLFSNKKYIMFSIVIRKKNHAFFLFLVSLLALIFISASKGFVLGTIAVLFLIVFFTSINSLLRHKMNYIFIHSLLLIIVLYFTMIGSGYFSIVTEMFNSDDVSNNERYKQLESILNDLSFMGNGLGAVVKGSIRSVDAPYGYELIYLNLVHKFGLFSIPLFAGWFYMFVKLVSSLYFKRSLPYSVLALSALGYLFPAIGNPILMHPSLVILNCFVLYYIRKMRLKECV